MAQGKKHRPSDATRGIVIALVAFGIPQDDIAAYVDIDPKTLREHYRLELNSGRVRANAKVIGNYFKIAIGQKGKVSDQRRAGEWYLERLSGLVLEPQAGEQPEDDWADETMTDRELAAMARRGRELRAARASRSKRAKGQGPLH